MVEVKIEWNEKSLKEYCKFNIFGKTKRTLIAIMTLVLIYAVILTGCIMLFFAFNFSQGLILAAMLTVFWGAGALFLRSVMNSTVKKAMEENKDNPAQSVILGEHSVLVCQDGDPIGEIRWDKITGVYLNDKAEAVYINTKNDAVLILEKKNIVSGSMEELSKIAKEKQRELTK